MISTAVMSNNKPYSCTNHKNSMVQLSLIHHRWNWAFGSHNIVPHLLLFCLSLVSFRHFQCESQWLSHFHALISAGSSTNDQSHTLIHTLWHPTCKQNMACMLFQRIMILLTTCEWVWTEIVYLSKLISSIKGPYDRTNGITNNHTYLVILSAYGNIYSNVKDYNNNNKKVHVDVGYEWQNMVVASISTFFLTKCCSRWKLDWWHNHLLRRPKFFQHSIAYLPPGLVGRQLGELVINFVGHVLHEPLEAFTVVILLELKLFADVTDWRSPPQGLPGVVILFVLLVHPHFHHSHVVLPAKTHWLVLNVISASSSSNDQSHTLTLTMYTGQHWTSSVPAQMTNLIL